MSLAYGAVEASPYTKGLGTGPRAIAIFVVIAVVVLIAYFVKNRR
jgi:hypothetical protein